MVKWYAPPSSPAFTAGPLVQRLSSMLCSWQNIGRESGQAPFLGNTEEGLEQKAGNPQPLVLFIHDKGHVPRNWSPGS